MARDHSADTPTGIFPLSRSIYGRGLTAADIALYGLLGTLSTYDRKTGQYVVRDVSRRVMAELLGFSISRLDKTLASLRREYLIFPTAMYEEDGTQAPTQYTLHTDTTK